VEFLTWLGRIYEKAGLFGTVVLLLAGGAFFAFPEMVKRVPRTNWLFGRKVDPIKCGAFIRLKTLVDCGVPSMRIECPLRKKVFSHILAVQITILREAMLEMAKDKTLMASPRPDFKNVMEYKFSKAFSAVRDKFEEDGVPRVAYAKFDMVFKPYEELAMRYISQVCESERVFDCNQERMVVVADFMSTLLVLSLTTVEGVISTLNGEMSRVEFRKYKCEQCSDKCPFIVKHISP